MSDIGYLIVGGFFAVIGAGSLAVQIKHRLSCSAVITATILHIQKKKSGYWRGKTFYQYFPTFRYSIQGEDYTVKYTSPVKRAEKYNKGGTAAIRYDPHAPEKIYAGANASAYIFGVLFTLFGLFLTVCYFI